MMSDFNWNYMIGYLSGDFHDETSANALAAALANSIGKVTRRK